MRTQAKVANEWIMPNGRARVLIVDDQKVLAWTIGMLLTKAGYEVETLNNPMLVRDALQKRPADLVISDVVMPEMSGIDLAIQLEQEHSSCKIILLSGQANTLQLLSKARAAGYDFEVFPKPIPPNDLLRLVEARVNGA